MIRKRVVRVLVYDGPVGWVQNTMRHNGVVGTFPSSGSPVDGGLIQETIVSAVCYDDEMPLPEEE